MSNCILVHYMDVQKSKIHYLAFAFSKLIDNEHDLRSMTSAVFEQMCKDSYLNICQSMIGLPSMGKRHTKKKRFSFTLISMVMLELSQISSQKLNSFIYSKTGVVSVSFSCRERSAFSQVKNLFICQIPVRVISL